MWPRLFAQLVELLPHATRLLPMADNFLATRRDADRAQAAALAAMSQSVREDIGRVSDSYGSLSKQLLEQKAVIAALQESVEVAHTQSITQTKQLEWITSDVNSLRVWVKFGTVLIIILLCVVIALTVQILHSR